jgi:hypothetical protein
VTEAPKPDAKAAADRATQTYTEIGQQKQQDAVQVAAKEADAPKPDKTTDQADLTPSKRDDAAELKAPRKADAKKDESKQDDQDGTGSDKGQTDKNRTQTNVRKKDSHKDEVSFTRHMNVDNDDGGD